MLGMRLEMRLGMHFILCKNEMCYKGMHLEMQNIVFFILIG